MCGGRGLTSLQRSSWYILQSQPTRLLRDGFLLNVTTLYSLTAKGIRGCSCNPLVDTECTYISAGKGIWQYSRKCFAEIIHIYKCIQQKQQQWHQQSFNVMMTLGVGYGFWVEVTLPLTRSTSAVPHDNTRLCRFYLTIRVCQILADAYITLQKSIDTEIGTWHKCTTKWVLNTKK